MTIAVLSPPREFKEIFYQGEGCQEAARAAQTIRAGKYTTDPLQVHTEPQRATPGTP